MHECPSLKPKTTCLHPNILHLYTPTIIMVSDEEQSTPQLVARSSSSKNEVDDKRTEGDVEKATDSILEDTGLD